MVLLLALLGCGSGIKSGPPGATLGEACGDDACARGLVCTQAGVCALPGDVGTTDAGEDCSATAECAWGLVCASDNVCGEPGGAGTGDDGAACDDDADCQAGFACDGGACVDLAIPFWEGGDCPEDEEGGDFYPLFDIPDLPASGMIDFYGLPFPNDTRRDVDGRPDWSGHPHPGDAGPSVAALIAHLESTRVGFPTNPTVFFRFNRAHDVSTITMLRDDATVHFVSLDADAPDYGELGAAQYFTRHGRGRYICRNWLGVTVWDGEPLQPEHTYAVYLTAGITDTAGQAATRDTGFRAVMGVERPPDTTVGKAWDAYAPFRAYVADRGLDAASIVGAAVFTTGTPTSGDRQLRDAAAVPTVSDVTRCDTSVLSPCDDGGVRACEAALPDAHELHARATLPRYRALGGPVSFDATFRPQAVGTEEVCLSITVPDGVPPDEGWPVAIVAGDAGGSFRDAARAGLAAELAAAGVATIGFELAGEGARVDAGVAAGAAVPTSPLAWLGNAQQATADLYALQALVSGWSIEADESPTGAALRFDASAVTLIGAGEGAAAAGRALPRSPDGVASAVLGDPPGLRITQLEGTRSLNLDAQSALADSNLTRWSPAMALFQAVMEPADPIVSALAIVREPPLSSRHLFVAQGVDAPTAPTTAFVRAASIPVAGAILVDTDQSTTALPATENAVTDDGLRTAASVQYEGGRDTVFDVARADVVRFVVSGTTGAPTIGE